MSNRGVNKVTLIGRLGDNPSVNQTTTGSKVANISIATSESWKDKVTQENVEKVEWHRIVFFNRLAEIVEQYLTKGAQVYIEGRLQTRKWQDNNGQDRYTTEIVASEMQMLGGRADNAGAGNNQGGGQRQAAAPVAAVGGAGAAGAQPDIDFTDDIPF